MSPVTGRVFIDGHPGERVVATCYNVKHLADPKLLSISLTTADDGVPPGEYRVNFDWRDWNDDWGRLDGEDKFGGRYREAESSPFRLIVVEGAASDLGTVELTREPNGAPQPDRAPHAYGARDTNHAAEVEMDRAGPDGATRHVSPSGSDGNPGTSSHPWRTLQQAALRLQPGDLCLVHAGIYRESVVISSGGTQSAPIRFQAVVPGTVIIHGGDLVEDEWQPHQGQIRRMRVSAPVTQVFVDDQQQTWARWPNRNRDSLWDRNSWAESGAGSRYGRLIDPAISHTGIDWTGAVAVLNVAHQFCTWTRPVVSCRLDEGAIGYAQNLVPLSGYDQRTKEWEDDRYYITGALAALDSAGEWYFDADEDLLYFWPPDDGPVGDHRIAVKRRDLGFDIRDAAFVELHDLRFVGCTVQISGDNNVIAGCEFDYPVFAQHIDEPGFEHTVQTTLVRGSGNVLRHCRLSSANAAGLTILGTSNVVEDCTVNDACWDGSLKLPAITLTNPAARSGSNSIRYCDVSNSGGPLIRHDGPGNIIEFCHLRDGGLCCKDVALLHGGSPRLEGTVLRYNWVHGCHPYSPNATRPGGLGIRGDDQTRGLTVHHNIVWDCGRDGIIIKGDFNEVHHNTVFDIGADGFAGNAVSLHREPEPKKPWVMQVDLLQEQNVHSRAYNNAVTSFTEDRRGTPFPERDGIGHNVVLSASEMKLADPAALDFRPTADSPLVDSGIELSGFDVSFVGEAPDVGAYEFGANRWVPGRRPSKPRGDVRHQSQERPDLGSRYVQQEP